MPTDQAILHAGLVVEMLVSYSVRAGSRHLLIYPEFREQLALYTHV